MFRKRYYYDQLLSYYSDQPNEPELWNLPRFVDEVEQVRTALRLNESNLYLLGQSWGLFCPNGSHFAMYHDHKIYMDGVIRFLRDVDRGSF